MNEALTRREGGYSFFFFFLAYIIRIRDRFLFVYFVEGKNLENLYSKRERSGRVCERWNSLIK